MFSVKENLVDGIMEVSYGDEETNYIMFPKDQWWDFVKVIIQVDEGVDHESVGTTKAP